MNWLTPPEVDEMVKDIYLRLLSLQLYRGRFSKHSVEGTLGIFGTRDHYGGTVLEYTTTNHQACFL